MQRLHHVRGRVASRRPLGIASQVKQGIDGSVVPCEGFDMIGLLRGQVLQTQPGQIIIGVGSDELGYVGYSVMVPARLEYESILPGRRVEFVIYSHVREDAHDLIGFSTQGERALFQSLVSVSGIGPKSALTVLSKVNPPALLQLIVAGKSEALTQFPGIGKKTAERIVIELADSLKKKLHAGDFEDLGGGAGIDSTLSLKSSESTSGARSASVFQDALAALMGLGYREQEAKSHLDRVSIGVGPLASVEELIRAVLKQPGA